MFNTDIDLVCMSCFGTLENGFCKNCGTQEKPNEQHMLQLREILAGKYLIGKVLGQGGFGITYVAFDLDLDVKVAIKEYFPNEHATRQKGESILPMSGEKTEKFNEWKDNFVKEARNLAKLSSLVGIVSVKDFFQERNTAYIVMEFVEGISLKQTLANNGGRLSIEQTLTYMEPIISSLEKVHKTGLVHRDISPDNIMISPNGRVKLIDFGAARFVSSNPTSLSIILKHGFAPEEQYRTHGNQGPWSDVYALCATMYRCITGETPLESLERIQNDTLQMPSECVNIQIPPYLDNVLMKGLQVFARDRYQSMEDLYKALYHTAQEPQKPSHTPSTKRKHAVVSVCIIVVLALIALIFYLSGIL